MNEEKWKSVKEDSRYKVSNHGRVTGPRNHILSGYYDKNGYHCVGLWNKGTNKALKVHRAVTEAFIREIPEGMQVNHKNGVKHDNRVENLEIVTPSENVFHSYRVLLRKDRNLKPSKGEDHHNSKLTENNVREIRRLYSAGQTQVQLGRIFNTPQTNISQIIRRKAWSHVI